MAITDCKLRVFLCHAAEDKPIVRELYQKLLAEGWIDPWLDEEKLLPGQNWNNEIEKAVELAHAVIVCLSRNSIIEGYVQAEMRFAIDIARTKPEESIFIIPLRLDDSPIPRRLRIWHYVDYYPMNQKKTSFSRLLKSLENRMVSVQTTIVDSNLGKDTDALDLEEEVDEFSLSELSKLIFLVHNVSAPQIDSDGVERRSIQIFVDSFSDHVLDEVEKVEYHLHPSFPRANQVAENRENRFELSTRGSGEFNITADVYFKGHEKPMVLHRYINFPLSKP